MKQITIHLTPEQSETIVRLAKKRNEGEYDRAQTRNLNPLRDEVGIAGEVATHLFLRERGVRFKPLWQDDRSGPDFEIQSIGLADVKTQTGAGRTVVWNGAQYLKWKAREWREDVLIFAKVNSNPEASPGYRYKSVTLLGWIDADQILKVPETKIVKVGDRLANGNECKWTCIETPTRCLNGMRGLVDLALK